MPSPDMNRQSRPGNQGAGSTAGGYNKCMYGQIGNDAQQPSEDQDFGRLGRCARAIIREPEKFFPV